MFSPVEQRPVQLQQRPYQRSMVVSSSQRDVTMYPNPNSYTVQLPWAIQGLQEIWLSMASFDAVAGPLAGILRIAELTPTGQTSGNFSGSNAGILAAIPLPLAGRVNYEPTEPLLVDCQKPWQVDYPVNLANLTISWLDENGAPLGIGNHVMRITFLSKNH